MLHTLLVGLGRSGRELHLPVLRKLRRDHAGTPPADGGHGTDEPLGADGSGRRAVGGHGAAERPLFAPDTPLGYDIAPPHTTVPGLRTVSSLAEARDALDPARTVVHLCTPPTERVGVLGEIARHGFRSVLVEKPVATGWAATEEMRRLQRAHRMRLAVVAPWLHSALTERLHALVRSGSLGALRRITVHQGKPRLHRSLSIPSHPSAFDVELPHSVGLALRLAGSASVEHARWTDARAGDTVVPRMGTAEMTLGHRSGPVSEFVTDLTSPRCERSVTLDFDAGRAVGHYPVNSADPYAQLRVSPIGLPEDVDLFPDLSLDACLLNMYRGFAAGADFTDDFALQAEVIDLLEQAKDRARDGVPTAGRAAGDWEGHRVG